MASRILIAEPFAWLLEQEALALERVGFEVIQARGLSAALIQAKEHAPHALVMRWDLRDGTAHELLDQLCRLKIKVPSVGIAGNVASARLLEAAGASPILRQPFGAEALERAVRKALSGKLFAK